MITSPTVFRLSLTFRRFRSDRETWNTTNPLSLSRSKQNRSRNTTQNVNKHRQTHNISTKQRTTSGTCCSVELFSLPRRVVRHSPVEGCNNTASPQSHINHTKEKHREYDASHYGYATYPTCCATRSVAYTAIYCKSSEPKQPAGNDYLPEASQTLSSTPPPPSTFRDRGDLFSSHPAASPIFPLRFECWQSTQLPRFRMW